MQIYYQRTMYERSKSKVYWIAYIIPPVYVWKKKCSSRPEMISKVRLRCTIDYIKTQRYRHVLLFWLKLQIALRYLKSKPTLYDWLQVDTKGQTCTFVLAKNWNCPHISQKFAYAVRLTNVLQHNGCLADLLFLLLFPSTVKSWVSSITSEEVPPMAVSTARESYQTAKVNILRRSS